jgi:predicted RNase H-like nuclease
MNYLGVDGCKNGWFCVSPGDNGDWSYRVIKDAKTLGEYAAHASSVLIDIPIGLLDKGTEERQCDKEARRLLRPKRSSSVFPAPARQTLQAVSYEQAQQFNRSSIGRGLSQQSWNIVPKIREIDDLLSSKSSLQGVVRECHPELCFWALNGNNAMRYNKKKEEGRHERLDVLENYFAPCHELFEQASSQYLRRQVALDDIIDAMVCAVTAKYGYNNYTTVPALPSKDTRGLPMEMVFWLP